MATITQAAADKIAMRLSGLEQEIDLAARSKARLPIDLLDEPARAGASPIAVRRVLEAAAKTFTALLAAGDKIVRTCGLLVADAKDAGLIEALGGQAEYCEFVTALG